MKTKTQIQVIKIAISCFKAQLIAARVENRSALLLAK